MFQDSLHHFQSSVSKVGLYSVKCPNSCSLTRYSSRSLAMLMSQFAARSRMGCSRCLYLQSSSDCELDILPCQDSETTHQMRDYNAGQALRDQPLGLEWQCSYVVPCFVFCLSCGALNLNRTSPEVASFGHILIGRPVFQ